MEQQQMWALLVHENLHMKDLKIYINTHTSSICRQAACKCPHFHTPFCKDTWITSQNGVAALTTRWFHSCSLTVLVVYTVLKVLHKLSSYLHLEKYEGVQTYCGVFCRQSCGTDIEDRNSYSACNEMFVLNETQTHIHIQLKHCITI